MAPLSGLSLNLKDSAGVAERFGGYKLAEGLQGFALRKNVCLAWYQVTVFFVPLPHP
jgi:hypothetical protein